jgi:hypothetical protein
MSNRQTLKRRRNRKNQKMRAYIKDFDYDAPVNCLADLCPPTPCEPACIKRNNKMNHMQIDVNAMPAIPTDEKQREYLLDRLSQIDWQKDKEIDKAFNIVDMDPPKTAKEMSDRITSGLYVIEGLDKTPDEKFSWCENWTHFFRWRDPSKPKDKAGAQKAREALEALLKTTKDTIVIKSPDEGLTALQALDAWVPTTTQ